MAELKNIAIIGPVYPYKGGISHYTGLLSRTLSGYAEGKYNITTISYKMQYPKIMFRKEQRDYSNKTFEIQDAEFWINTANPFNWMKVKSKLKKLKPDLLVVQWWHPYFAPCYQWILSGLKTKVLFVCHNVLPHERFPMDRFLTKGTLKKGNMCIVHSKEDEKDLKELLPGMLYERGVLPTYQAFRLRGLSRAEARKELGISPEEKMILFFGLVRKYKGLPYLIKAMPEILQENPDLKLYVVGDFGSSKEEYLQLIEETGCRENIVVRDGYVPDEEVEPYFAAADLNICPYESATQSAIVQIAFGFDLPVVATAVGGLPEAVTDEKTGFVVEPRNPKALADAINRYYGENRKDEFRENVQKEKERFSWERTVEMIERLWEKSM